MPQDDQKVVFLVRLQARPELNLLKPRRQMQIFATVACNSKILGLMLALVSDKLTFEDSCADFFQNLRASPAAKQWHVELALATIYSSANHPSPPRSHRLLEIGSSDSADVFRF